MTRWRARCAGIFARKDRPEKGLLGPLATSPAATLGPGRDELKTIAGEAVLRGETNYSAGCSADCCFLGAIQNASGRSNRKWALILSATLQIASAPSSATRV